MTPSTQKIIPHLWFDGQAEEAVKFYTSLFKHSSTGAVTRYTKAGFEIHQQPEGQIMTIDFSLDGYKFIALNGGPYFKFTPAISFFVVCTTEAETDELWRQLSDGGMVMMPLDKYEWSDKYGWLSDRYGVSWQIAFGKLEDVGQKITPTLMYVGDQAGRAEEAITLYTSVFEDSSVVGILRYGPGGEDREGTVKHAQFKLDDEVFMAMDSAIPHAFNFNEAISLLVNCETQEEIDYYWDRLSEGGDPKAQVCGWLKDKFGVSWQIAPTELNDMIQDPDPAKLERVTNAYMKMKKFDITELRRAFEGR